MLPIYQSQSKEMSLMQTNWASQINPVLSNDLINGIALDAIDLIIGSNTINHLLGRKQVGWFITDINVPSMIYRSQPLSATTLTLTSSAVCTVNLWVF